jgi:hypothetical protein
LTVEQLKASIEILQLIHSNDGIKIHIEDKDYCYTNIRNPYISITTNHNNIGPDTVPKETPIKIKVDKLLHPYYGTNAQLYISSEDYVLKTINEVLFHRGDRVVYKGLYFLYILFRVCLHIICFRKRFTGRNQWLLYN